MNDFISAQDWAKLIEIPVRVREYDIDLVLVRVRIFAVLMKVDLYMDLVSFPWVPSWSE